METKQRKLTIKIARFFSIYDKSVRQPAGKLVKCSVDFASFRTDDVRITYINDITTCSKEELALLSEDERFLEPCYFEVYDMYLKEVIQTFEGTFVDALTYLKDNFFDIQDEGERNAR